jgi:hypothetical protein
MPIARRLFGAIHSRMYYLDGLCQINEYLNGSRLLTRDRLVTIALSLKIKSRSRSMVITSRQVGASFPATRPSPHPNV